MVQYYHNDIVTRVELTQITIYYSGLTYVSYNLLSYMLLCITHHFAFAISAQTLSIIYSMYVFIFTALLFIAIFLWFIGMR